MSSRVPPAPSPRPSPIHRWIGPVLLVAALGASTRSGAHPFGDDFGAQQVELELDRAGVYLRYTAEVPHPDITGSTRPPTRAEASARLDELLHGLVLTIDDTTVPLVETGRDQRADLSTPTATLLTLFLEAEVDLSGTHDITLGNANLQGEPSWYHTTLSVPVSARVLEASLLPEAPGGGHHDLTDTWSRSELRRRTHLVLSLPADPWSAWVDRVEDGPVPLAQAVPVPLRQAWWTGRRGPDVAALHLLAAFALGVATGGRVRPDDGPRRPWITALQAAPILALTALPWADLPREPVIVAGLSAVGLVATSPRDDPPGGIRMLGLGLATGLMVALAADSPWRLACGVAMAAGLLVAPARGRFVRAGFVLALVALWATRGGL